MSRERSAASPGRPTLFIGVEGCTVRSSILCHNSNPLAIAILELPRCELASDGRGWDSVAKDVRQPSGHCHRHNDDIVSTACRIPDDLCDG